MDCSIYVGEENALSDQLHSHWEADLHICFHIYKKQIFSWRGSNTTDFVKTHFSVIVHRDEKLSI